MTGFGRILADLNAAGVRYVVVGGIAVVRPHGDVDLLAERPSPLSFLEPSARADECKVDGIAAPIASLADLVALKRFAGRDRDLLDLRSLEEAHGALPEPPDANS